MDALDRMFHVLVRTLRARHPQWLASPFSVGDLYQQVLPYRHFRRDLGLETNQEYELVLMELLSGARGYLDVDERLRDELGRELHSAAPEPSRVRAFAEAQVSLNASAAASVAPAGDASPGPDAAASGGSGASRTVPIRPQPTTARALAGAKSASEASARPANGCRYCGGALPSGRLANYCPHCGQNLRVHNCPACGAELESGWKFCVSCGKGVA